MESLPPPPEAVRRILIVDDDSARRGMLRRMLTHEGYDVDDLADGADLLDHVRSRPPDLVLLDIMLPGISGFELCGDLRMMNEMTLTPIVLITAACLDEESVVRGLFSGADDYIVMPSRLKELRARIRVQLRNRRDRELLQWARARGASLHNAAMCDPLTGIANRRAIDREIDEVLKGAEGLLLVLLDIDHFKKVNDTYGHAAGDRVLVEVARCLGTRTRARDLAGRYGGEEFMIVIRGARLGVADSIGERYRNAIRDLVLDGGPERVTVSIGIAGCSGAAPRLARAELFAAADAALYEAKHGGRDRVVVASPDGYPTAARKPTE